MFQHVLTLPLFAISLHWHSSLSSSSDAYPDHHHQPITGAPPPPTAPLFVCTLDSIMMVLPTTTTAHRNGNDSSSGALVFEIASTDGDRVRASEAERDDDLQRAAVSARLTPTLSLRPPGLLWIVKVSRGNLLLVDAALRVFKVSLCRPVVQFLLQTIVAISPPTGTAASTAPLPPAALDHHAVAAAAAMQWAMVIAPSQHDKLAEMCVAVGRAACALALPGLSRAFTFELHLALGRCDEAYQLLVKGGSHCFHHHPHHHHHHQHVEEEDDNDARRRRHGTNPQPSTLTLRP